jgi:electron transfer flavoprotein alpha subunit
VSEVVGIADGSFEVGCCNGKMRRKVKPATAQAVLTLQAGAFSLQGDAQGTPTVVPLDVAGAGKVEFLGFEPAEAKDVDLGKAEVIVSAGRGIGKKENVPVIAALAKAFGGELGASRPVVDSGWVEHSHQVGTTGQTVGPKLYVACGISGAIQHLAGMKKSDFIVAINKDKDAPIGEIADVLIVADVMQFVPALTAKLQK